METIKAKGRNTEEKANGSIDNLWYTFTLLHILATVDLWILPYLLELVGIERLQKGYSYCNTLRQGHDIHEEFEFTKQRYNKNILSYNELRYKTCIYVLYNNFFDKDETCDVDLNYKIIKETLLEYVNKFNNSIHKIIASNKNMEKENSGFDYSQIIAEIFCKKLLMNNIITKTEFKKLLK